MAAGFIPEDIDIEQKGVDTTVTSEKFREEVYEHMWIIPDWERIQRSKVALLAQIFEFETGRSTGVQTKWKTCFKFCNSETYFYMSLKLIETKGFLDERIKASTNRCVFKGSSPVYLMETPTDDIRLGQEVKTPVVTLCFDSDRWISESWMSSNGELTFKIKICIMEPDLPSTNLKTELFHKTSFTKVRTNLAKLIGDQATADFKIITRDEKELLAHKVILKAQCPVFESMFRSEFSENKTGIVNVKDVSAKTMGIFLHLFYTGELLPSWTDNDTVVEFTYAVGTYQLTEVLKLLDEVLGSRDETDAFHTDVQLLDLAKKLDLKVAEKELLARVKKAMSKVNSVDEFFGLYGEVKQ